MHETQGRDCWCRNFGVGFDWRRRVVANNTPADQINTGRGYVRANLRATQFGVDIRLMSQSLQECPEVSQSFAEIHQLLGASGDERIQMLARIGFGRPVNPAPRWPLETHFI